MTIFDDTYLMEGSPKFLGMIPQRFRIYGGQPTQIAVSEIAKLERTVFSEIVGPLRRLNPSSTRRRQAVKLGEVKDYTSLVQQAQTQGVPLADVEHGDEVQKRAADKSFSSIAKKIIIRVSST